MSNVAQLYDHLLSLNSKRKNEEAYPIHKSLNYEDTSSKNLYEYLIKNYDLPKEGNLLDCGCGVGYGSLLLASQFQDLQVTGISLSNSEIAAAIKSLKRRDQSSNCHFEVRSFDSLPEKTYDCIVAIESLKHSPNIEGTMQGLVRSLRKDGKLIIIEDVLKSPLQNFVTRRQCSDWELQKLMLSSDYLDEADLTSKEVRDLSHLVKLPSMIAILIRIAFAEILVGLSHLGIRKTISSKIIRGGFYQELLYKRGRLNYVILAAKKES